MSGEDEEAGEVGGGGGDAGDLGRVTEGDDSLRR